MQYAREQKKIVHGSVGNVAFYEELRPMLNGIETARGHSGKEI